MSATVTRTGAVPPTVAVVRTAAVPDDLDVRLSRLLTRTVAGRGAHHAIAALQTDDGAVTWAGAASPGAGGGSPAATEDGAPLGPATPFFVASVTKRVIVTLVLQAHERGELDLDAPVVTLLPPSTTDGLHVHRGTDRTAAITVRHLASHTAGLPDHFERPLRRPGAARRPSLYADLAAGTDRTWSFDDVLRWNREDHRPHFPPQDLARPRQRARYSDTGFQLLLHLLEVTTGRTFGELLTERIVDPLGLTRTWLPGRTRPQVGTPAPTRIFADDRPLHLPGMLRSSNDLTSTVGDLLRFERALTRGELFADPRTAEVLVERANLLPNAFPLRYGVGTMRFHVSRLSAPGSRPLTLVGHSGATGTWLFTCPELGVRLAGTIDQATGRARPFRLMIRMLRAWAGAGSPGA